MIKKSNDIDISSLAPETELIDTFIKLFGKDNIEIYNKEFVGGRTKEGERTGTYIITFILFGEIKFVAYINDDITDEKFLDIKIKHEYSRACDTLKDLLLRLDRYFINEIM